jgi:hypothetical protein
MQLWAATVTYRLSRNLVCHPACGLDDGCFDILAVDSQSVYFAKTAITGCADIIRVRVSPTTLLVAFEGVAIGAVGLRTATDLPARDEGVHVLDPRDTHLVLVDGLPDAFQAIDVRPRVPTVICARLVRRYQPFPLVVT